MRNNTANHFSPQQVDVTSRLQNCPALKRPPNMLINKPRKLTLFN